MMVDREAVLVNIEIRLKWEDVLGALERLVRDTPPCDVRHKHLARLRRLHEKLDKNYYKGHGIPTNLPPLDGEDI